MISSDVSQVMQEVVGANSPIPWWSSRGELWEARCDNSTWVLAAEFSIKQQNNSHLSGVQCACNPVGYLLVTDAIAGASF